MTQSGSFEKLCSPIRIGRLTLKNRMVKAPQATFYVESDCFVTERLKHFYESIAAGGAGMTVLGGAAWEPPVLQGKYIGFFDDKFIPGLRELAAVFKRHGCPVFAQFHHPGPAAPQDAEGGPPIGPSPLTEDELPSPPPLLRAPRGLTVAEIEDLQERHTRAAVRAREAGFDGVEVHAANGYLFASFLSRIWNKRTDRYGVQDFASRARIVVEVIGKIKERLGADYPVGVRINGEEWGAERRIVPAESSRIAMLLQEAGADYVSVCGYGYGPYPFRYCPDYWPYPEPEEHMKPFMRAFKGQGIFMPGIAAVKKAVSVPVIGVGRLDAPLAEEVLRQGKADLIAFGRALWADPELPNKVVAGRADEIAPCTRCSTCEDPPQTARRCRINAAMGKEREYAILRAAGRKRVMVIGGGPAGMEVARVAAVRGHDVTLYEKTSKLGGLLPLAAMIKGLELEDLLAIVRYQRLQMERLKIDLRLDTEADAALVERLRPDALVIATGGASTLPAIPGVDGPNVLGSSALYAKVRTPLGLFGPKVLATLTRYYLPVARKVVILGGRIEGCQSAVFLVKRGRNVTIVEESEELAKGVPERYRSRLIPWLSKKGVASFTGARCEEITARGARLLTREGKSMTIEAGTVMVTMPQGPKTDLFSALKDKVPEVYMVGACNGAESGLIVNAFADGRRIGCAL